MPATRPIQREVTTRDVQAAYGLAVHETMGKFYGPDAHPGLLITNEATAGVPVKPQLGGGFFNPLKKTSKFR